MTRRITWAGLPNTWDLGGLDGALGTTRYGRVYRSAMLDALDEAGRAELYDGGVRTIIDLRNDDEIAAAADDPFTRHHRPVEDQSDAEFMAKWPTLDSPGYYVDVLERWPDLVVGVFGVLAAPHTDGEDEAVLVHCAHGRDRTGMITAMLLQLCAVEREAIVADYLGAVRAIGDHVAATGDAAHIARESPELDARRSRELEEFLDVIDTERFLLGNGLSPADIDRVRGRLLR
ncbi:tyrosine-protein phosphatase [Agromyces endophyticus]|uniref:tyrosine-protein phosphatase n=1 Tax=Agromyces sp. H17E-10 TaxID=2932244 RepID=UPI001FD417B1|nr:tyrosine-protein phosphatase [Agromyces sp. H17E-10]UOQ90901.1 tyrosine-protein phosphatase [Agromyces sp. H17E-10]